jgi:hypothetical protein
MVNIRSIPDALSAARFALRADRLNLFLSFRMDKPTLLFFGDGPRSAFSAIRRACRLRLRFGDITLSS